MTRDVSYPIAAVLTAGFAVGVVWHGVSSGKLWRTAEVAAPIAASEPVPPELFAEPIATPLPELVVNEPLSMPLSVFPAIEAPVIHAPLAEPETTQPEETPAIQPPTIEPPAPTVAEAEPAIAEPEIEIARPALPPVDAERYTAATTELSQKLLPEVQAAFAAGKQGSLFVSQQRFMAVLQQIATAKDAAEGSRDHAHALRAAIVALEEAEEFTQTGDASSTEIDPANIAASHVTPVVREADATDLLPHTAIAHYHQYAVANFMRAAGGEQAASMALFGLGRVNARLGDEVAQSSLKSQTYYEAALGVHPQNHLAANELAVLLAQAGRYGHASSVLRQAVQQPAPSYVHHNLAVVEAKLGNAEVAAGADAYAADLLAQEKLTGAFGRNQGVQWVNPEQFATTSEGLPSAAAPKTNTPPTTAAQPTPASGWRQAMGMPKKLMGY